MQGPHEVVVTDEMVEEGHAQLPASHRASIVAIYRAMAAVAPQQRADEAVSAYIRKLEAENAKLRADPAPSSGARSFRDTVASRMATDPEFCAALRAEDEEDHSQTLVSYGKQILKQRERIATLEAELAAPVELYRADERKIDALTEQRDAWAAIATRQDARLAALEVENTALRTRAGERDASAFQALRRRVTSWPLVALAAACLTLSACSTPVTTMRNPMTGAVATCGGGVGGSILGGVAGYNIEQSLDQKCQAQLLAGGFERVR